MVCSFATGELYIVTVQNPISLGHLLERRDEQNTEHCYEWHTNNEDLGHPPDHMVQNQTDSTEPKSTQLLIAQ